MEDMTCLSQIDAIRGKYRYSRRADRIAPFPRVAKKTEYTKLQMRRSDMSTRDPISNQNQFTVEIQMDPLNNKNKVRQNRKRRDVLISNTTKTSLLSSSSSSSSTRKSARQLNRQSPPIPGRWKKFRQKRLSRFSVKEKDSFAKYDSLDQVQTIKEKENVRFEKNDQAITQDRRRRRKGSRQNETKKTDSRAFSSDEKQCVPIDDATIETTTPSSQSKITQQEQRQNNNSQLTNKNKANRKRVEVSANEKYSRTIILDDESTAIFLEYMNQRAEDYSQISSNESSKNKSRRWILRGLTDDESIQYQNNSNAKRNYFRLAASLMSIIGLDLTPVVDLEVTPPNTHDNNELSTSYDDNVKIPVRLGSRWRRRISSAVNRDVEKIPENTIKIRSMRVDLLSTEQEISNAMKTELKDYINKKERIEEDFDTTSFSSKNRDIQQFGEEAIAMFGKIDENFSPRLEFDTTISWSTIETEKKSKLNKIKVAMTSSILVSLTIPTLPFPVPIPSAVLVKQIGSIIAKRILVLSLPRFLNQLGKRNNILIHLYQCYNIVDHR